MILIGSRALKIRFPKLLGREPLDFDFIGNENEIFEWCKKHNFIDAKKEDDGKKIISKENTCEFEIIVPNSSNELLKNIVESDSKTIKTEFGLVPNLDILFTLKKSHRYLKNSPHFWKTALDYHRMKSFGCSVKPEYETFFKLREKETYNYSHPKLNVTKKDFFKDDNIQYLYDHDDIHKSIALLDKPAYIYYLKDGEQVLTDKNKFFACSEEVRISGVIEEACVLALERSLIPFKDVMTPKQAWLFALSKVCTSITSGYFREYAYENIFDIVKKYPENYYDRFKKALEEGKIKNFKE